MTTCPICRDVRSFAIRSGLTKGRAVVVQAGMHAEVEAGGKRARAGMGKHTSCSKAMHDPGEMRGGRRYTQHRGLARNAREGVGTIACGAERGHAGGVNDEQSGECAVCAWIESAD